MFVLSVLGINALLCVPHGHCASFFYIIVSSSLSLHNRSRLCVDDVVLSNACMRRYDKLLLLINKKKEKEDLEATCRNEECMFSINLVFTRLCVSITCSFRFAFS